MSKCLHCPQAGKHAFCNLSHDARTFLETHSVSGEYPRGEAIFREGERCDAVFVLCSGRAKVTSTSREGRTLLMRVADAGDVLGLTAALQNTDYEVTVEALEPCRVRVLHVKHLREMMLSYQDVTMGAATALAEDYRAAFDHARMIGMPGSPAARLARLLLEWAADSKRKGAATVMMPLTHDELASMTATTRETITRTMSKFRKEKLIATKGISLTVLQPAALERLSAC